MHVFVMCCLANSYLETLCGFLILNKRLFVGALCAAVYQFVFGRKHDTNTESQ